MVGPIPRFYGEPGDPDILSLLEPDEAGGAAPAEAFAEVGPAASVPEDDLAGEMEEFALPEEEPPVARAPRTQQPLPQQEERPKASMPEAAEQAVDLEESLDLEEVLSPKEVAAPRTAPAESKRATGEEDEELAQLLATDDEESPAAVGEAPKAAAVSREDEDLLSLLDEADEAASAAVPKTPPRAAPPQEASMEDLLLEETEAGKEAPASPVRGKAVGQNAEEGDVSSLWADAFTEEPGAASPAAPKDLLEEVAAPQPAGAGGEEDLSSTWSGAFDEEAGTPAAGKKGVPPPVGASTGGGDDSLSDMWSEAFAEQEAVAKAQREGKGAPAADLGEGDLEKMWADALNESGDAQPPRVHAAEGPAAPSLDAEEDLGSFLDEADVPSSPSGVVPAESAGVSAAEKEEEAAPAPRRGGDFMADDEDPDEIEAYVPEEAPAAAAVAEEEPRAEGGDFFEGAAAPTGEPQEEEKAEVVGVPFSVRFVAGAMDFGVLAVLQGIFLWISFGIVSKVAGPVTSNMEALILLGILNLAVLFLLSIFYSVYFVGMFGCTPGQRSMGLSVVDADDKPVEYMQAVLRYFGGLAACLPLGLGHMLVLFDKRSRGLGDRLAGTHVVLKVKV